MSRYIIISSHTAEDCTQAVKYFREHHAGFLTHFEWGCYDNDHTAYTFVDADNHEMALLSVPPLFRDRAKAVKVVHFNPKKTGDQMHEKKD